MCYLWLVSASFSSFVVFIEKKHNFSFFLRVFPGHQMATTFFIILHFCFPLNQKKNKNKNKYTFLFYFNLLCSYTHTHARTLRSWGGVCPTDRHGKERETECPRRGGGEEGRRGGGREREVLNGTPKPLRGSVGKVTWPELGPFYIRRQSNLSCVWTVRYFVGSDFFFSLLINYLLHHHITIRGGGDVSCERIKLISGTIMPTGRWWDSNYVSALCWPLPFYKSEINQLSLLQSFVLLKPKSAFLNQYLKKEEEEENVKKIKKTMLQWTLLQQPDNRAGGSRTTTGFVLILAIAVALAALHSASAWRNERSKYLTLSLSCCCLWCPSTLYWKERENKRHTARYRAQRSARTHTCHNIAPFK